MNYATMELKEIAKLNAVSDLSLRVRGPFAQALKAEAQGDHAKGEERLARACEMEAIS